MFRPSVLMTALLFSAPSLWNALTSANADPMAALLRFAIALPIAGVLLGLIRQAAARRQTPQD